MASLSTSTVSKEKYLLQARHLKQDIVRHFYDPSTGVYRLSKSLPAGGICQDAKAHALTLDILPSHCDDLEHLTDPDSNLPRAFRGLNHWDVANVASPYGTGFAVEALLGRDRGVEAVKLIERVWGPMADITSPNYSGGHWEALKPDGTPHGHDTSLMHGWSTWPVFLLPRYLAGLQPTEPGWKSFSVTPVLAGLTDIKCILETVAGTIGVELDVDETNGHGALKVLSPYGVRARLQAPQGWVIQGPDSVEGTGAWQKFFLSKASSSKNSDTTSTTQTMDAPSENPCISREQQNNSLLGRIRSSLSRFTAVLA